MKIAALRIAAALVLVASMTGCVYDPCYPYGCTQP